MYIFNLFTCIYIIYVHTHSYVGIIYLYSHSIFDEITQI